MSNWVKLNPAEFSKPEHKLIRGVDVEVFLSPYDIPEAVRGSFDETTRRFVIEFKYIGGDEPQETQEQNEAVRLQIGRHSKRLYQIQLAVDPSKDKAVGLRVFLPKLDKALDVLAKSVGASRSTRNYDVAKQILAKRADKLVAHASAA